MLNAAQRVYNGSFTLSDVGSTLFGYASDVATQPISIANVVELYIQASNRFSLFLMVGAGVGVVYEALKFAGMKREVDNDYDVNDHWRITNYFFGNKKMTWFSKTGLKASLYGEEMISRQDAPILSEAKATLLSMSCTVLFNMAYHGMNFANMSESYKSLAITGMILSYFGPNIYNRTKAVVTKVSDWWNEEPVKPLSEDERKALKRYKAFYGAMTISIKNHSNLSSDAVVAAIHQNFEKSAFAQAALEKAKKEGIAEGNESIIDALRDTVSDLNKDLSPGSENSGDKSGWINVTNLANIVNKACGASVFEITTKDQQKILKSCGEDLSI